MLTLTVDAGRADVRPLPHGYTCRPITRADVDTLGELYFASYPPGVACSTIDEATADVRATFDGEYGELWPEASLVVVTGGRLAAAVMTVHRAPWPDTPDCPFIIELFTSPDDRRRGLGRYLVARALAAAARTARPRVALRVDAGNMAAVALYESLGFATA